MTSQFNIGDRVWYHEDPRDTGTVTETEAPSDDLPASVLGAVFVEYDSGEACWTDIATLRPVMT